MLSPRRAHPPRGSTVHDEDAPGARFAHALLHEHCPPSHARLPISPPKRRTNAANCRAARRQRQLGRRARRADPAVEITERAYGVTCG